MEQKRPLNRKTFDSGKSARATRRGSGLGTGPVGKRNGTSSGGRNIRPSSGGSGSGGTRAGIGGGLGTIVIIALILFKVFGGGSDGGSLLSSIGSLGSLGDMTSISGYSSGGSNASMSDVDRTVASGSRNKRTVINGNGNDKNTVMIYLCGTDLESRSGMASKDLSEMASAMLSDNVNVIVYTGGCKGWKSDISNKHNQIYQIKDGRLKCLVENDGDQSILEPSTLTSFIKWCNANFPANRRSLILWDHGGGSVAGFGYDERNGRGYSLTLSKLNTALKNAGTTFDFVGFDACLMATAETAFMLNNYADYMIASEETEPGIGWYYTRWLTELSKNPSMDTLSLGKIVIDDYTQQCQRQCAGQKTTLSLIDLAEFSNTVPSALGNFSNNISEKISAKQYTEVSDARNQTREFGQRSKIDQIDLADMADKVGTEDAKALSKAVKGAVKYNRTSSNMTNSYGVSIYFPYKKASYVDKACQTYEEIGMDDEYSKCIKKFAAVEVTGQLSSGGTDSPFGSLFGELIGGGSSSGANTSFDLSSIVGMLSDFSGGSSSGLGIAGLDLSNIGFLRSSGMTDEELAGIVSENHLEASDFTFIDKNGKKVLHLSEEKWGLVNSADQNMFVYDNGGYIDLGLDNVFDFDSDGDMTAATEATWLGINGQPVAYYHTDTTQVGDYYSITGYVPALLNGNRVKLILVFDSDNEQGYIVGAENVYSSDETDTVAKSITELKDGDRIDFLCDFYSEDGQYDDSYMLGEQMIVDGTPEIANVSLENEKIKISYKFTDIYNNEYWTSVR